LYPLCDDLVTRNVARLVTMPSQPSKEMSIPFLEFVGVYAASRLASDLPL
jgi:hypothetical protein